MNATRTGDVGTDVVTVEGACPKCGTKIRAKVKVPMRTAERKIKSAIDELADAVIKVMKP